MNKCNCCGKCCQTSPPTLHLEDKSLILNDIISKNNLITLRKGEVVFDHTASKYVFISQELVKLVTKNNACIFLSKQNKCLIYSNRPIECKYFLCTNQKYILQIKNKHILNRFNLISINSAIGNIIQEHEQICSIEKIKECIINKKEGKLKEMILFDINLREILKEKLSIPNDRLNFYFGRPVTTIINIIKTFV
ncbi:MAG: YkgJ family cysteine cluster protein [Desulfonauticus sp.]|nr:YkgJ family cysteine cluster protein [Desulfonauticus sp.]